jgi:hypothetical protein
LAAAVLVGPVPVRAGTADLTADLDGKAIRLVDVSRYACHDIDYPKIHCFTSQAARDLSAAPLLASATSSYVIAWDQATYAGGSFIFSEDYTALAVIGWNDRISSFKVQNSQTGHWYTDWFYGGSSWYFCCNTQQPILNAYDDTFSSIHRL